MSASERRHLAQCARCQAEMALWTAFNDNEGRAEDDADVNAIVAQLSKDARPSIVSISAWRMRMFAIAASLVIAVAIGYALQNREPSINVPAGASAYRSASVELIAPKGDLASAPAELRWNAIAGARQYDVAVLEVDRTTLWHASTSDTKVALPPSVAEQCVPGKTILWQVTARRDTTVIAQSAMQRFRVKTR